MFYTQALLHRSTPAQKKSQFQPQFNWSAGVSSGKASSGTSSAHANRNCTSVFDSRIAILSTVFDDGHTSPAGKVHQGQTNCFWRSAPALCEGGAVCKGRYALRCLSVVSVFQNIYASMRLHPHTCTSLHLHMQISRCIRVFNCILTPAPMHLHLQSFIQLYRLPGCTCEDVFTCILTPGYMLYTCIDLVTCIIPVPYAP